MSVCACVSEEEKTFESNKGDKTVRFMPYKCGTEQDFAIFET